MGLINLGINLKTSKKDKVPDFEFLYNGKRYFIEAIAPTQSTTSDKPPDIELDVVGDLPKDKFLMRITSAISEKKINIMKTT